MLLQADVNGTAVYCICVALGVAMLLAYNAFIASPSYVSKYYTFALRDENATTEMPGFWKNMETYIVIASMVPNVFCQMFIVTPRGQALSMHLRLLWSTVAMFFSVVIVTIIPAFKPQEKAAAGLFLGAVVLSGAAAAFLQSSAFGLASSLADRFVQATMLGIGMCGAGTSGLRIIIKAAVGDPDFEGQERQANAFFGLALGWLALCVVMILLMPRVAFLKQRVPEYGGDVEYDRKNRLSVTEPADDSLIDVKEEETPLTDEHPVHGSPMRIIRCIWQLMLANFLIYTVSLIVFPQLGAAASDKEYYGVVSIFMYNLGDTSGRFVCRFRAVHITPKALLPISLVRFILVPLMILCVEPKLIPGYIVPAIIMYVVGITNGFTSSLCMMYGPSTLSLADNERASAGSAMSFSLLGGCSAGSLFALLVNQFVKPN
jgi:hypothetical protein